MTETNDVTINVRLVNVIGSSWIGAARVGGITVRGHRSDDPLKALQSTLAALSSTSNDEAATGLELELAGTTFDTVTAAAPAPAGPALAPSAAPVSDT